MWHQGLLQVSFFESIIAVLILTHISILSVTIYLHRYSAHRALELHPALKHFFRFWLWLTTGTGTQEWTAVHRKHHAKCETKDDPHSPVIFGVKTVLFHGWQLYRDEISNQETLKVYGQGTPDDWLEHHLYQPYKGFGPISMLVIDILLFGVLGLTVWAIQMLWMPFFAAGVINGLGHYFGYRNFECKDAATNIIPLGLLIGGEELHNNHHTYPNSAKLSAKGWEFDIGWLWIKVFKYLRLAWNINQGPIKHIIPGKQVIDTATALGALNDRFSIMARYAKDVVIPLVRHEFKGNKNLYRRARALLCQEPSLIDAHGLQKLDQILARSDVLKTIYQFKDALLIVWQKRVQGVDEVLKALELWCEEAEQSGIQALTEFSAYLRTYSLPKPA